MADQSDVMDMLALIAEGAVFPNGLDAPSVLGPAVQVQDPTNPTGSPVWGNTVDIAQGWPMADSLDATLRVGRSTVTVYAVPSTTTNLPTPFNFDPGTVSGPAYGMGAQGDYQGFTLWGKPNVGEYVTVVLNGSHAYSYAALPGDLVETVMAILANQIAADFPGSAWSGQSVTLMGVRSLMIRIGGPAMVGEVIGRQRQQFRVTVWSPNPADRTAIGRAIDVALRKSLKVVFPDTSTGIITFQGSNLSDERQNVDIYRRDIIVFVQWDTLDIYPAYEVTAVTYGLSSGEPPVQRAG